MNPISILIVDDEPPARNKLRRYLEADRRFQVIEECGDGPQTLASIESLKPDLLLLDVQMPGMTGFDVLRLLGEYRPQVIFVTAYEEYAVRAFDVSAVDYLLKPVGRKRFNEALEKFIKQWDGKVLDKDPTLVLNALEAPAYPARLAVRRLDRVLLIAVADISHIVSEQRLISIYTHDNQRFWTGETLDQLQKRLNPDTFFRSHRGSLINLEGRFEIEPWKDGRLRLHYESGKTLVVSREPARKLRELISF